MAKTYVQTRYQQVYTQVMTSTQTFMYVDVVPANNSGYATIREGYSDQEDVKWTGITGLQLTGMLRGLSPTALTDTEVVGLKQPHSVNSPSSINTVWLTNIHYIINDKASVSANETIAGTYTFSAAPVMGGILDTNNVQVVTFSPTASAVNNLVFQNSATGTNVLAYPAGTDTNITLELQGKGTGVVVIPDKSTTKTSAAPTAAAQIANKAYVDAQVATVAGGATYTAIEAIALGAPTAVAKNNSGDIENLIAANLNATPTNVLFDNAATLTGLRTCQVTRDTVMVSYIRSSNLYVVAGTVNVTSSVITWGTPQLVASTITSPSCCNIGSGTIAIAYVDSSNNGQVIAATVAGTVFTFGSAAQFRAATVTIPFIIGVTTNTFGIVYNHSSGNGEIVGGTIAGTVVTVDTANKQQFVNSTVSLIDACLLTTNKIYIAAKQSSKGTGYVSTFSGTVPVPGTGVDYTTNNLTSVETATLTTTTAIIHWFDSTAVINAAIVASVAGSVITYPTSQLQITSGANTLARVYAVSPTQAVTLFRSANSGDMQEVNIAGTVISLTGIIINFNSTTQNADLAVGKVNENGKFIIVYTDQAATAGRGIVFQEYDNIDTYNGIAQASIVAGGTGTVKQIGIDTNQTGLTAGTMATIQGRVIGYALSATSMVVVVNNIGQEYKAVYAVDTGSANAYYIDVIPEVATLTAGQRFIVKALNTNTAASTLTVSGSAAIAIRKTDSSTALVANEIINGGLFEVCYDGTNFQLISPSATIIQTKNGTATRDLTTASSVQNIAHGLGRIPKIVRLHATTGSNNEGGGFSGINIMGGVYNGSTTSGWSTNFYYGASLLGTSAVSTTNILNYVDHAGNSQVATVTVDATNIILSWTKGGNPAAATLQISFDVEGF